MAAQDVSAEIIAMECAALDRWIRGDPTGFLEICAPTGCKCHDEAR
jgi:hypothetical protein